MWYSPASFVSVGAWASLIFLAPSEVTVTYRVAPAIIARASRIAACDAATPALPDSIALEDGLQPIVQLLLERSPKFREQCRALAAAPRLRATVSVSARPAIGTTRARTSFRQNESGALAAAIEIRSALELTELLAHEFEHLIEQLDGVDLKALSREGEAHRLADGAFETDRAIAAGQQVAGEVLHNTPDRVRSAGASVWRTLRRAVGVRGSAR
jgi:hypothetical protein